MCRTKETPLKLKQLESFYFFELVRDNFLPSL